MTTAAERIEAVLAKAVAGGLAGVAAAAVLPGGEVVEAAAGVRGLDTGAPMTPDSVFWIASLTKALTSTAVLQLVEAGKLDLDAPVGRWLPALASPKVLTGFDAAGAPVLAAAKTAVTARHLLSHTSGLAYDFCNADLARYAAAAGGGPRGETPLMFEPGTAWTYGVGLDWAGELVAAVSGQTLDVYLAEHVFAPLGMADTGFAPPSAAQAEGRLVSMHARTPDGLVVIPFPLPPAPNPMMGGGGLYSTAGDYLTFLRAILAGGAPILSPASVAMMGANEWEGTEVGVLPGVNPQLCAGFDPFPGKAKRHGLGFVSNPEPGPAGRAAGSLAWAGLANCYYWADPARRAAGVFLAQVLPFGDAAALEAFGDFERAVYSG
jgi:CubicO group peptidase (beta-lactamase class C family)